MKYKGLVDPKNKRFGNLLPFEVQVIIMFWTQCFMTNDRRTKMNEEFTHLPRCLRTGIPMRVAFSFSSGHKRFSSAMENKPYPSFYGCPHCFRRKTKQYLYVWTFILFCNSFALCLRGLVVILFTSMTTSQSFTFKQYFLNTLFLPDWYGCDREQAWKEIQGCSNRSHFRFTVRLLRSFHSIVPISS